MDSFRITEDITVMMRTKHLFLAVACVLATTACTTQDGEGEGGSGNDSTATHKVCIADIAPDDTVFVCTGSASKRFHAIENCTGLVSCTKEVRPLTRAEAEQQRRSHCHICIEDK